MPRPTLKLIRTPDAGLGPSPNSILVARTISFGSSASGSKWKFSATCSSCGREAQVPFRPTGSKPVYCSDCFTNQRASSNRY